MHINTEYYSNSIPNKHIDIQLTYFFSSYCKFWYKTRWIIYVIFM